MKTHKKALKKKAPVVVNRKFMLDLANDIYNPKTRRFLRLCAGTLQNGPDPTDEKRPMHCGLGELHYAMTGNQPEDDHVSEEDVVDMAANRSTIGKRQDDLITKIKMMKLPTLVQQNLIDALDDNDATDSTGSSCNPFELEFRNALHAIPSTNDANNCHGETCSYDVYRTRSARVAKQLRVAASFLPE